MSPLTQVLIERMSFISLDAIHLHSAMQVHSMRNKTGNVLCFVTPMSQQNYKEPRDRMSGLYRHAPEGDRRRELIEATLECISELGIQSTTVRAVAARAGVSNGLIRHHFENKANLIVAAYRRTMELITEASFAVLASETGTPHQRLSLFVQATLGGQASEYRMISLWATFISQIKVDPMIAALRDEEYLNLRRATEPLIAEVFAAEGRSLTQGEVERMAIVVHAVLDGLWIEVCLAETGKTAEQLIELGIRSFETLMGVKLDMPPPL